jgi:hypothetical protein
MVRAAAQAAEKTGEISDSSCLQGIYNTFCHTARGVRIAEDD